MPKKNNSDLIVYIFNVVEDEWSFISSINNPIKRFDYITEAENATDAYFLSVATESGFVYISPKIIDFDFQDYAQGVFKYKDSKVITPTTRTHLICEDLINDSKALNRLISKAKNYKRTVLMSYAVSAEFYSLKQLLEKAGLNVFTPEAPKIENAWTINFFGSKSGIRQLAQKSLSKEPNFMMPDGVICVGRFDAAKIAASKYIKQKGVVIKTNKGSGGSGVLIFRENDLSTEYHLCEKQILEAMSDDRYWDNYPIIIEDLININFGSDNVMPNVEFRIHQNGRIEMLYVCSCKVTLKGKFYGLDINEDIIDDRLQTKIEHLGYFIAEEYLKAGYRGYFDIDIVMDKNKKLYVCESNTRNTGGTDVYKIARKLIGKDFMDKVYVVSRSQEIAVTDDKNLFGRFIKLLEKYLYTGRNKQGLIINSKNNLDKGKFLYIIFAKNKKQALDLEAEIIEVLKREKLIV